MQRHHHRLAVKNFQIKRLAALARQSHKGDVQFTLRQHRHQRRHIGLHLMYSHRHILYLKLANKRKDFGMESV
ncbi:hypothetical protein D3C86_2170110 [compost metagenome]